MSITRDQSMSFGSQTQGGQEFSYQGPTSLTSTRTVTLVRTRTGQRLNNWRQIIESGGNATTPLTARWDSLDSPRLPRQECMTYGSSGPSKWIKFWTRGDVPLTNNQRNIFPGPTLSTDFVDNLARAAFYKKLAALNTKFRGLTFLGELRESLHMLRRPAAALWDSTHGYLGALSKRKRANPRAWTKELSGLWLEHSFGWLPLINDCKDAVKAYSAMTSPKPATQKLSGSVRKSYDTSNAVLGSMVFTREGSIRQIDGGMHWGVDRSVVRETHTVRYSGAIRSQVEAPQWDNWALFGFRPAEFLPTAWELLPWSFLVDYFTNIGDILDSTITDTRNLAWVNKSTIRETEWQFTCSPRPESSAAIWGASGKVLWADRQGCSMVTKRRDVSRVANSGIPMPRLQFSFDLTDGQLGNIAALLGQARALHPQQIRHFRV